MLYSLIGHYSLILGLSVSSLIFFSSIKNFRNEKILDNSNKVIVDIDKKYFRPIDVENLKGDSSKARKVLNWKPKFNIDDLVEEMCLFEIENIKQNND